MAYLGFVPMAAICFTERAFPLQSCSGSKTQRRERGGVAFSFTVCNVWTIQQWSQVMHGRLNVTAVNLVGSWWWRILFASALSSFLCLKNTEFQWRRGPHLILSLLLLPNFTKKWWLVWMSWTPLKVNSGRNICQCTFTCLCTDLLI